MLDRILDFSLKNKLIVILFTITVAAFGLFSVLRIPVGAVPDITNNQVQVKTYCRIFKLLKNCFWSSKLTDFVYTPAVLHRDDICKISGRFYSRTSDSNYNR